MFCLSLGVRQIDEVLPAIAYAFLSGLNASTVGIVALAAVQVSRNFIARMHYDVLTRTSWQRKLSATKSPVYWSSSVPALDYVTQPCGTSQSSLLPAVLLQLYGICG